MTGPGRGNSIGASMPEGTLTVKQLADEIEVSPDTIRRWCESGALTYHETKRGDLNVRTFDAEDVALARRLKDGTGYRVTDRM